MRFVSGVIFIFTICICEEGKKNVQQKALRIASVKRTNCFNCIALVKRMSFVNCIWTSEEDKLHELHLNWRGERLWFMSFFLYTMKIYAGQ
jgi:hypothetical protein